MSAVRCASESDSCVLPVVRDANATNVSQLQPGSGTRMVELPALRSKIALTSTADHLVAIGTENQRFYTGKNSIVRAGVQRRSCSYFS
jgi:hypothetical protein